jgi:hypothetical protein
VVISIPDCEEGPDVRRPTMGSTYMMHHLPKACGPLRLSIALDVIGNRALGSDLFVLGGETCRTTADLVARVPGEPDAAPIPGSVPIVEQAPLFPKPGKRFHKGDYIGAIETGVPFLFVISGTSTTYHTTSDVPESVDFSKLQAVTRYAAGLILQAANDTTPLAPFSATAVDPVADVKGITRAIEYLTENEPAGLRRQMRATLQHDLARLSGFRERLDAGGALTAAEYQAVRAAALDMQKALARPDKSLFGIILQEAFCRLGIALVRRFPWLAR